jgi:type I restriction enzyme S subunit
MTRICRLGDVCEIDMGQAPAGAAYNSDARGWPLVAGAGDFGELYPAPKKFTEQAPKLSRPGDIILGIRATIGEKVLSDGVYCLGRGVAGLRPKEELDARYLWHWLTYIGPTLAAKARGATFKQVNKTDIAELRIPLPDPAEQRRIAADLDGAFALERARERALLELDDLTAAIFFELFGDTEDCEWPIETVASIAASNSAAIRTGPFGSQLLHSEFVADGIAVLGIDNAVHNEFRWDKRRFITEEKYAQLRRYTVKPGDVLITIMGTCGRCAVVPDEIPTAINTKHLCCITLDREKCLPVFLHAYFLRHRLARRYLSQRAKGAIMAGLNMEIIKKMPILLPPLPAQHEFARRVAAVDKMRTRQRGSLVEMRRLIESLTYRAFRGDRGEAPSGAAEAVYALSA